jgi:hypothetical protein
MCNEHKIGAATNNFPLAKKKKRKRKSGESPKYSAERATANISAQGSGSGPCRPLTRKQAHTNSTLQEDTI